MTDKNKPKIVEYKDFKKNDKKELQNAIKTMASMLPELIEIQKLKSIYKKSAYDEYLKQGFSDLQAMQIVSTEKTPFDN